MKQGCHGRGKYLESDFVSRSDREKSENFMIGLGKFRKELKSQGGSGILMLSGKVIYAQKYLSVP